MRRQRGFTLVEVLVALVITAAVAGLLLAVGTQAGGVRARLALRSVQAERAELGASWFRNSVEGLIQTDIAESWAQGSPTRFTGLTIIPLDGDIGAAAAMDWAIQPDGVGEALVWRSVAGESWVTHRWRGKGARFAYLGPDLQWYDNWGAVGDPGDPALHAGRNPPIPSAVRLWFGEAGDGRVWVAAPRRTAN